MRVRGAFPQRFSPVSQARCGTCANALRSCRDALLLADRRVVFAGRVICCECQGLRRALAARLASRIDAATTPREILRLSRDVLRSRGDLRADHATPSQPWLAVDFAGERCIYDESIDGDVPVRPGGAH